MNDQAMLTNFDLVVKCLKELGWKEDTTGDVNKTTMSPANTIYIKHPDKDVMYSFEDHSNNFCINDKVIKITDAFTVDEVPLNVFCKIINMITLVVKSEENISKYSQGVIAKG